MISNQLADIFNISFFIEVYPTILKVAHNVEISHIKLKN